VQQLGRALHVGEEECDGAGRKLAVHRTMMSDGEPQGHPNAAWFMRGAGA
jgi:hypothetical protein